MIVKLPEVCNIQYGFAFDSANFSEDERFLPLVRIRDVVRGYSETYYSGDYSDEYIVREGDLLIGMDGEFNIARWRSRNALLNQRVCRVTANAGTVEEYLRYALSKALKTIEDKTAFVTVKHLSAKELNKLILDVPDFEEQKRIAKILSAIERIIWIRQLELQKLDDLIKARFVEMFGDLKNNPRGWPVHRFEEITEIITDGEHATPRRVNNGIYLLSARNVLDHGLQLNDVDFIDQEEYDRIAKRIVPQAGDVLISCSGSVGRCCTVPKGIRFQMVRSAALLRFDKRVLPKFAEYMITSDDLQDQINSSKTASSQANLFQGKIAKLRGFVPPIELQEQFATFVTQVDKSRVVMQKALDEAQLLFDSLMQKYFG